MKYFELLKLSKMYSGHLCLELTEDIDWETFPHVADRIMRFVGLNLIDQIDSPTTRIWNVRKGDAIMRLVFDDYPLMMTVESSNALGDIQLREIYRILKSVNTHANQ